MSTSIHEKISTEDPGSIGALLTGMMRDLGTLLHQEVDLARAELTEKAVRARGGLLLAGLAVGIGVTALVTMSAAVVLGLTVLLSLWMTPAAAAALGALIVAVGLGAGSYALFRRGLAQAGAGGFVPERTLTSLKENAQWASRQIR